MYDGHIVSYSSQAAAAAEVYVDCVMLPAVVADHAADQRWNSQNI
jgi:hypothetical protein